MSINAPTLRIVVQALHQPHITVTDDSIRRSAIYLRSQGVTVRRLLAAATAVDLADTGVVDSLVQWLKALDYPVVRVHCATA